MSTHRSSPLTATIATAVGESGVATARGGKLSALEGLRGLLALLVCAGHYGLNDLGARFGVQVRFDAAVDVFFAISGFVMSRAYYLERRTFGELVASRVARLYPLHLLTMLWAMALSYAGSVDWTLLAQNLLLVQNIGLPPNRWAFNFPSWSISVEMAVSLLFYWLVRRDRPLLVAALLSLGAALSAFELASGMTPALNHLGVFNSGLMRGIGGFALGCAAYLLALRAPASCARLGALAPAAALALLAFFVARDWSWPVSLPFALIVFATVLTTAAAGDVPLLSSRPLVWLGAVSYSVYLLHIPLLWSASTLLGEPVDGLGRLPLIAVVLVAAQLCYRYFELPAQRWVLARLSRPGQR